jgi:translation initiation factor IF-1
MPAPNPIRSTGTLLHARPDGRSWDATAPNGWPLIAHLPGKSTPTFSCSEGDRVILEFTAYDFSMARIAGPANPLSHPPQTAETAAAPPADSA